MVASNVSSLIAITFDGVLKGELNGIRLALRLATGSGTGTLVNPKDDGIPMTLA